MKKTSTEVFLNGTMNVGMNTALTQTYKTIKKNLSLIAQGYEFDMLAWNEGQHIDFKIIEDIRLNFGMFPFTQPAHGRDYELKKIYGKAISALSNTGGGYVVWGIYAPNRAAERIYLIKNLTAFKWYLDSALKQVTRPRQKTVTNEIYYFNTEHDAGVIITCIPPKLTSAVYSLFTPTGMPTAYIRQIDHSVPATAEYLKKLRWKFKP